jgi:hypothetical protein
MRRPGFLLALWFTACAADRAGLVVTVVEPATASAQYFHGNCFAGFALGLDLRVQETQRVGVTLSRVSYRLTERETGAFIAEETLDARAIQDREGEGAIAVPPGSARVFRIGATVSEPPRGSLRIAGTLEGVDENGGSVRTSFDLDTAVVVSATEPPAGGACGASGVPR